MSEIAISVDRLIILLIAIVDYCSTSYSLTQKRLKIMQMFEMILSHKLQVDCLEAIVRYRPRAATYRDRRKDYAPAHDSLHALAYHLQPYSQIDFRAMGVRPSAPRC